MGDKCNLSELIEERATARGLEKGLYALVNSLRTIIPELSKMYEIIISNPGYESVTLDQVETIYKELNSGL